jgi:hypothetical protein
MTGREEDSWHDPLDCRGGCVTKHEIVRKEGGNSVLPSPVQAGVEPLGRSCRRLHPAVK